MKLFNGQIFDAVFSLGFNCRTALYLRDARLRDCSGPFDWVTIAAFEERINSLTSDFADWLKAENLEYVGVVVSGALHEHDRYDDRISHYAYLHDFPAGHPLEQTYPAVKAKYDRRIKRMLERLDAGGRYLFVWWSVEKESDESLLAALTRLRGRFGNSGISLLAIDNGGGDGVEYSEVSGSDGCIFRASGKILDGQLDMVGVEKRAVPIFRRIRVRGVFIRRLRWGVGRFLIHALIWYLPTKNLRRRFKAFLNPILLGNLA